jgi:hypothetical protein
MNKMYQDEKSTFEKSGTIMLMNDKNIFSDSELSSLERISDSLPFEHIELGDAAEPNFLEVGRLMTDVDKPTLVNKPLSEEALEIVSSNRVMEFYKFLLNKSDLYIRRMQYNVMGEDCFVGLHLDTDSNPDYLVAVVIQLGDNFEGGDYVVYGGGLPPRSFHPPRFSVIVSDCRFEHEVTKIISGLRKSLVFFLSSNNGKNKRLK